MEPDCAYSGAGRCGQKKRISVIDRLNAFYCGPEDNGDFTDADFGLGGIPAEVLDQAVDILFFLESIEWKWDINTLMAQPADLFHAVLRLMMAGNKLKKQAERKRTDE